MAKKIAINGFGRIGRLSFRIAFDNPEFEIVAVNDLTDTKTLAHLLKYDSNYGIYGKTVDFDEENLIVDGKNIRVFAEKDPEILPWADLGVELVLECTGFFLDKEKAGKHLKAGAKKVVISAAAKGEGVPILIMGVNESDYNPAEHDIVSNGSCTTNCLAPVVKILNDKIGIEKGFMTTVHSYTNDQNILDLPHKDLRRARAAAISIIPTTTGAAKAVTKAISELAGNIDGIAMRVPTSVVSIVDFVAVMKRDTSVEEINNFFIEAANGEMKGVLGAASEELVSVDFKANPLSSIVDLPLTSVNGNLIKVCSWYDNEYGYSCRLVDMAAMVAKSF
ncbi:MAG: type I glyceraldehyde-3-phosphate dehydrogenase [Candidatus Pacebacteria bacterium]|nr:type I glyceraldehyde-3-phosphate dehydrogenase [Candidatus Paceibacterota bacterium]